MTPKTRKKLQKIKKQLNDILEDEEEINEQQLEERDSKKSLLLGNNTKPISLEEKK